MADHAERDETVYTFFDGDGPIRLTETELCNAYMDQRRFAAEETERAIAAEARVTAHERTASLACDLLNALQPWGLQSPEVRSAATRLTLALAALTPPSDAAALAKEACAVPGCGRQRTSHNRWCQECNEAAPPPPALAKEDTDD